jgi:hypothetical protein
MARTAVRVLAIAMTLAAGNHRLRAETEAPRACAAGDTVPGQIRPMGCRTAMAMANGMVRSATLRRMVDRVGELNGIVYIEDRYYVNDRTGRVLSGALSHHITVAGAHRVLHLLVAPESANRQLTTIAHELQHAIEVLEATEVKNDAAVDRLFERIGVNTSAGIMETQAALDMERAVGRELSAKRDPVNASTGTLLSRSGRWLTPARSSRSTSSGSEPIKTVAFRRRSSDWLSPR